MSTPQKTKDSTEQKTLEEAMAQLDTIIERMESGELPLDRLLEDFESGAALIKVCQERLGSAEKKIRAISKSLDGSLSLEPFQTPHDE